MKKIVLILMISFSFNSFAIVDGDQIKVQDPASLKEAREQVRKIEGLIEAIKSKNIRDAVNLLGIDDVIPNDWNEIFAGDGSIINAGNFEKAKSEIIRKIYAVMKENYNQAQIRAENIGKLAEEANKTEDLKSAIDLQNKIALEQLALQNNVNKVEQVNNMLNREEKLVLKRDQLLQKCSLQKSLSKSETAKEYGYEISQECVDFLNGREKQFTISNSANNNSQQSTSNNSRQNQNNSRTNANNRQNNNTNNNRYTREELVYWTRGSDGKMHANVRGTAVTNHYERNKNLSTQRKIDEAINASNGIKLDGSNGKCGRFVQRSLKIGGFNIEQSPEAKDFGGALKRAGFNETNINYQNAKKGDVVVFDAVPGHSSGHTAIYNGENWVSDFKQNSFYVSPAYRNGRYKIYRAE